MKIPLILLLSFIQTLKAQPQGTHLIGETPKYQSRQKDFYEKRVSPNGETNFALAYHKANLEKQFFDNKILNKKTNSWTPLGPFGKDDLAGIGRINDVIFDPQDTGTYYICVGQGGLWKTTNSGKSWISISGDLPILRTSSLAIHPQNSATMYVATGDFAYISHNLMANGSKRNSHYGLGVYKTTNAGQTWKPTGLSFEQTDFEGSLIQRIIIHPNEPDKIIAVGQKGSYFSSDAGVNWLRTDTALFWDLEIDMQNPNRLYATTGYLHAYKIGEAAILYSNDFGLTWTRSQAPFKKTAEVQRIEIAQSPADPAYLYAIACDAEAISLDDGFFGFYQSTDTGKTWITKQSATYKYNLLGWDVKANAGSGGQGKYDLAILADKNNKNKVSIGGINIWVTTDGGSNFLPATYWRLNYDRLSLHADIHSLRQHPGGRVFACHDGGLSATSVIIGDVPKDLEDGTKISTLWDHFTNGLNITSFYRIGVNPDSVSRLMAGAQDNSTSTLLDKSWFNLSGGDGMECAFSGDNFWAYSSSQYGQIHQFEYLPISGDFIYNATLQKPAEQAEWTTPFVAVEDKLYVGFGNLYLYDVSDVFGQALTSFPNMQDFSFPKPICALAVSKNLSKRTYLAKRSYALDNIKGEVWTSSLGSAFKDISGNLPLELYPSYLYSIDKSDDEVWVTFSGFEAGKKVYYSNNAGDTWLNISFNLPNIPVNCVAVQNDKKRNVYVGTDNGVYLLDKTKNEWVLYANGLPNVIVSELEIHPKTGRLLAATFGAGVWEVDLFSVDSNISVKKLKVGNVELKLSPNPAMDLVTLNISGLAFGSYQMKAIDITGKTIMTKVFDQTKPDYSEQIDVSSWLSGEYFIIVEKDGVRTVGRFVKR